jgi:hypothetical protein
MNVLNGVRTSDLHETRALPNRLTNHNKQLAKHSYKQTKPSIFQSNSIPSRMKPYR